MHTIDYHALVNEPEPPPPQAPATAQPVLKHTYRGAGTKLSEIEIAEQCIRALKSHRADARDEWLNVLFALHAADSGPRGRELARDFSKQSAKYDESDFERVWASIKDGKGENNTTLGSLVTWAREDGAKIQFYATKTPPLNGATQRDDNGPILRCLADVTPREVRWLWPGRIPLGKFTMVSGDPGLGKSFVSLDIAARLSTGREFCDGALCEMGSTIILSAEDDAEDTIRPRLDVMNADVRRVNVLDAVKVGGKEKHFDLAADLAALERAIHETPGLRLIVIDPISAYLGKTDSHKNAEVRGILTPLSRVISRLNVAVVGISHERKSAGTKAVYQSIGSIAFNGHARAVWTVQKDADDARRRLFLPVKMNLCAEPTGLAYRLDSSGIVEWEQDPVSITADEVVAAAGRERKSDVAVTWLQRVLAASPVDVSQLREDCKAAGFSWSTIERAKDVAGVEAVRIGGFAGQGRWQWALRPSRSDSHR